MVTLAWGSTHVFITNHLEGREDLNLHCKSKDDDLGQHVLHYNQYFKITFGPNYFLQTLFFCSFQWGNGPFLYYNVYDQSKDLFKCAHDCRWYVHKDGLCRYEEDSRYIRKCYPWKH
ncbi:hypothetical protein PHAVU_008G063400 [Phaseolus vulgaris]|uniref:S-protein homolog n=1 Tax=Phaseolus vulgaris TaxID=3885 RepID=V7B5U6_PHAVU|nr:hypothetical protein PHAVU_008G063400g [Phaseolus vulgaris]ESW11846.1 hypothetical protein PHAVU_008G063400g [Phaseolus vulgaris]